MTGHNADDEGEWRRTLAASRREKDEFFSDHPQSPIPPDERDAFEGLDYFEPNVDYRVEATVRVHEEPDPLELETSAGPPVRYLRVVTFEFTVDGTGVTLSAYRQEGDEGTLFVPFADATTGDETYSQGRYLDLEPEEELDDGDTVRLDFNLAYNPFCAYSDTFACPLPPEENRLDVAVRAGERHPRNR